MRIRNLNLQIEHIKYIKKKEAKGKLKEIYKHIELDFGVLAEPFALHSLNKELTAGVWAMLYETVLTDSKVRRSLKEAIATSISEINKCNYCVDAHSMMIFGTEKSLQNNISTLKKAETEPKTKEDKLIFWALQNLNFDSEIIINPPFSKEEAPEIIGTAVLFHYLNRMVNLFAGDSPLPIKKMKGVLINIASKLVFAKAIKKNKIKGESLKFIDKDIDSNTFDWANPIPEIKKAFQYFKYQTNNKIDKILSPGLISLLKTQATNLNLLKPGFGNEKLVFFLKPVEPTGRQMAEFCFLTMFEPHKIYEKQINELKQTLNDEEILNTAAFVSMLIAESIGKKLFENIDLK